MLSVKCDHCNMDISEYVYVVNKYCWCKKCFDEFVMPQIKMSVEEYLHPFANKERRDSNQSLSL